MVSKNQDFLLNEIKLEVQRNCEIGIIDVIFIKNEESLNSNLRRVRSVAWIPEFVIKN